MSKKNRIEHTLLRQKLKRRLHNSGVFILLVFLAGCRSSHTPKNIKKSSFEEAISGDLPIPLGARKSIFESGKVAFSTSESRQELAQFYREQMELFGWRLFAHSEYDSETVLVFENPLELCIIIFKQERSKTFVTLRRLILA